KAQGKSVVHLYNTDLEELNLIYPTRQEQVKISNFFSGIDNLITLHQHKLEKLENLKKAYLNELFV
ncbi:MAG TPA: restriction endonuclease subunit S, partial [Epulopiscium sp.]|nr:restriction endonuclease subunit S [Candidatus Epulonipiscium sp.]